MFRRLLFSILLVILSVAIPGKAQALSLPTYQFAIPSALADIELSVVSTLAVDDEKNIYIVAYGNPENLSIYKVDMSGNYLETIGPLPAYPWSMNFDSGGNIYVGASCEVYKFDPTGQNLLDTLIPNEDCMDVGPFDFSGIVFDSQGNVYANGADAALIEKFDSNGDYLSTITPSSSASDMAIDSQDRLYLVDYANNRIDKIDSSGNHIAYIGAGLLLDPKGVAVDSSGNVYVADQGNDLVRKFDSSGTLLYNLEGDGTSNGEFADPWDVAVSDSGNLYVSDTSRVTVFDPAFIDGPYVMVSRGALSMTEGGSGSFNVSLSTQPAADVTVSLSVLDPLEGSSATVSTSTLVFRADNWNIVKNVSVSSINDASYSGNRTAFITQTVSSSDEDYDGYQLSPLFVDIVEDDSTDTTTTGCSASDSIDLCEEMTYEVDNRLSDLTANNSTQSVWTSRGNGDGGWTRSASFWGNGGADNLDFTGVSPWNSYGGYYRAGTLITPRHMVVANHYLIPNGSTVAFVASDNTLVTRTVASQEKIENTDIQLLLLDSDVPASIAYYPILSYDQLQDYFSDLKIPLAIFNQTDKPIIRDFVGFTGAALRTDSIINHATLSAGSSYYDFTGSVIGGDSGDAIFFLINNQPVLASLHTGSLSGYFYGRYIDEINQSILDLGNGNDYTVSLPDLSGFTPDSAPEVTPASFSVTENSVVGTTVGTVSATDPYGGAAISYSIQSGNDDNAFRINSVTGVITVNDQSALDIGVHPTFNLVIAAADDWPYPMTDTSTVTVTLTEADVTAPVRTAGSPASELTAGTVSATLSLTTDETATCKYGTVASTAYASIANTFTTTGGTAHSQTLTGLTNGTSYNYYARCVDGSANANATDYTISFSIASPALSSGSTAARRATVQAPLATLPTPTAPSTLASLQSQLAFLRAQLASLGNPVSKSTFSQPLYLGLTNSSVKALQVFLNTHGFPIATIGAGSPGQETDYFGKLTRQALGKFQLANHLITSPSDVAFGYLGPKTRALINGLK